MPSAALQLKVNEVLRPSNVAQLLEQRADLVQKLMMPGTLTDVMQEAAVELGISFEADEKDWIDSLGYTAQEMLRVAVVAAIEQGKQPNVTWKPGGTEVIVTTWDTGEIVGVLIEGPR